MGSMGSEQMTSKPVIAATAAELFVADIQTSCDYFTRKLGFSCFYLRKGAVGCQDFIVEDPGGNLLLFAGPAE
jgi:hypothetical protein